MTEKNGNNERRLMNKLIFWVIVVLWGLVMSVGGFFAKTAFNNLQAEDKRICLDLDLEKAKTEKLKDDIADIKIEQREMKVYLQLLLKAQGVPGTEIKKALNSTDTNK